MGQQCAARPKQPDKVELINTSYPLLPSTTPVKSIGYIKFSLSLWLVTDFQTRILLLCPAPQHDSYTADLPPRKSFSLTQKIICCVVVVRSEQKLTFNLKVNKKKHCSWCPIEARLKSTLVNISQAFPPALSSPTKEAQKGVDCPMQVVFGFITLLEM